MIREKILDHTKEEVPHSVAVLIDSFEEKDNLVAISAHDFVERDSQKGIIIGEKGSLLKKVGTEAREEIEKMIEKKYI